MDRKMGVQINKIIIIIASIIVFLLFIFSIIFALINVNNTNILNGILINGIDISGMSKEEATDTISKLINEKEGKGITVSIIDDTQNVSFESLEIKYDISSAISEAYNTGRTGNIFQNNFTILNLIKNKKEIDIPINLNDTKLNNLISDLSSNLPNKIIQSSYYIDNNNLIITSGSPGDTIEIESFKIDLNSVLKNISNTDNYLESKIIEAIPESINVDNIYNELYKEAKDAYYEKEPFKIYPEVIGISFDKDYTKETMQTYKEEYVIPLQITYPKISTSDLDIDIFKDTISNYTTKYDISNADRTTNLELAASKIDGIILAPGEEFSYNTTVGARNIASGYKEAKVYSNGKVVDGIGGGICQISSTLYNCAVYANLDIIERHNHQFITSYVPAGRDATVVYGSKDLKLRNNRSYPIKIQTKVSNGIVSCSAYGIKEDNEYNVDFDIETISVTEPPVKYERDESLQDGTIKQKGANGTVVKVYKIVKEEGSIISKDLLSQDTYNTLEKIIVENWK